jgi:hypothetical protein
VILYNSKWFATKKMLSRQINIIRSVMTKETVLLGGFNLGWSMKCNPNYASKNCFVDFKTELADFGPTQLCLFKRLDVAPVQIRLGAFEIVSKGLVNVSRLIFDSN